MTSPKKPVQIKCRGSGILPLESLEVYQGELKELHDEDYRKFRNQLNKIKRNGEEIEWLSQ